MDAPLNDLGKLTRGNRAIRKNMFLFWDVYMPDELFADFKDPGSHPGIMPFGLWRYKQPGDQKDVRDEKCVAKKRPGNPRVVGLDDYPCWGYAKHYVICQAEPFMEI